MEIKRIDSSESNLVIELFDKYRVFYNQPSDIELAKNFIQNRLDKNESAIFVAFEKTENSLISTGFTQLYPKFSSGKAIKIWVLNDLYVESVYRKQSIGEQLIHASLDYAKKDGAHHVELSTAIDNFNAQSLYEKIGFVKQNPSTTFLNYKIEI